MKLNAFLADPVDSECKVVYLLCEVRKLLERVPAHQRPFALNMYCHWALHVDLHGSGVDGEREGQAWLACPLVVPSLLRWIGNLGATLTTPFLSH
jgi:hypothetical protein